MKKDPNILVGPETSDDAGVYKISDEIALVQTVDFFTPIVDDPYTFGQIAVSNALSDIYAMGAIPLTALNLVAFPVKKLSIDVLKEILLGGLSKIDEAKVALIGGHTIEDQEIKYGLSVTGLIHPDRILTNSNAKPGDWLVLTKPLGTGIIATALKGGMASDEAVKKMVEAMVTLNRIASEKMRDFETHSCTDITGFGFIGHSLEMAKASGVGMRIDSKRIPILPGAIEYASMGLIPAGGHTNRQFFSCKVVVKENVPQPIIDLLYDPQTSGGLLISLPPQDAERLVRVLKKENIDSWIIGEVTKNFELIEIV